MKTIVLTWTDSKGAISKAEVSAPTLTPAERDEIAAIARKYSFLTSGDVWTFSGSSADTVAFEHEARAADFGIEWRKRD